MELSSKTYPKIKFDIDQDGTITKESINNILDMYSASKHLEKDVTIKSAISLFETINLVGLSNFLKFFLVLGGFKSENKDVVLEDYGLFKTTPLPAIDKKKKKVQHSDVMSLFKDLSGNSVGTFTNSFVSFDIETTGLNVQKDKIIQLSAVKYVDGKLVDTFDTLVNPRQQLMPRITEITGITNGELKDAPDLDKVANDFIKFIDGSLLVGHNIGTFDLKLIHNQFKQIGIDFSNYSFVDTLVVVKRIFNYKKNSLEALESRFNIGTTLKEKGYLDKDVAHNSLNDSFTTAELYLIILDK